jgi:lipoyl(octanoyl) transferase/dATP pyrophosphohydrolase
LGLPEFWQGVSGALEPDESFSDAARREVAEETGFSLTAVVDAEFQHAYPIRPQWRPHYGPVPTEVVERVFFAQVAASAKPMLSTEHRSWRWCSPREAAELLTFGGNAQCLAAVERRVAKELAF